MADYVPTSGAWQTDPQLQSLIDRYIRALSAPNPRTGQPYAGGGVSGNGALNAIGDELSRYVAQNRQRLGIPANYHPDIQTHGQTLYDPNQNQFRNAAITGAAMGAGAYGLGSLGSAAPSAASGGTQAAYDAGMFGAPSGTASGVAAGTSGLGTVAPVAGGAAAAAASGSSILQKLMSPAGIASLAGIVPALMGGGGGSGSKAQEDLLNEALKRSQRVDPLHQAVTQLAYSRLPISAREGTSLTGK